MRPIITSKEDAPALGLRETKRQKTQEVIRSVAMDLFETHGYDQTSIDDIARGAMVSPPTIFRYFETKDKLVLLEAYQDLDWLEKAFALDEGRSALHALEELNEIRHAESAPGSVRARSIRILSASPSLRDALSKLERRYRLAFIAPLKAEFAGQDDGLMKAEITAAMLAGSSSVAVELIADASQPQQMFRAVFGFIRETLKPTPQT